MLGLGIALLFLVYMIYHIERPDKMLCAQFFLMLFSQALISLLGAPTFIVYISDLCNVIMLIRLVVSQNGRFNLPYKMAPIVGAIFLFFAVGTISAIANGVGLQLLLWSYRSYGRYLIFILGVIKFWSPKMTRVVIKSFFPILLVNLVVSIIQTVSGAHTDTIGGVFGNVVAINAYSIFFFMIAGGYYIDSLIVKREPVWRAVIAFVSIFACVIMADLKAFFVLFIVETFVILFQHKLKPRVFLLIGIGFVLGLIIYYVSMSVYNSTNIFSWEYILEYLTESSYSYSDNSINRTDGIGIINDVFHFGFGEKLFGMGLGAGEYNSFFQGDVYTYYSSTHYTWFMYAWLYLETGWVGLVLFVSIFVLMAWLLLHNRRQNTSLERIGAALVATSPILLIYNAAFHSDCAYILYLFVGIALIRYVRGKGEHEAFEL